MSNDYFIDSHLHFFNLEDIPIYASARNLVPVNVLTTMALTLSAALKPDIKNAALKKVEPIIRFFERPIKENIEIFAAGLSQIRKRDWLKKTSTILTPLIIDFELIESPPAKKLINQVRHLRQSIDEASEILDALQTKIFPLLGVDLRRFKDGDLDAKWDQFFEMFGKIQSAKDRRNPTDLRNGEFIGLKLYPSIGFLPFPEKEQGRDNYLRFYQLCVENSIPITVHCQRSGYRGGVKKGIFSQDFGHPDGREKVLNEVPDLRINFAHFGAESEAFKTVPPVTRKKNPTPYNKLFPDTWTYGIIKLLKTHKNAYSDLSAFDWKNEKAVMALLYILIYDENGLIDEQIGSDSQYKLKDKILWGSDVPMILPGAPDYGCFDRFLGRFTDENFEGVNEYYPYDASKFEILPDVKMLIDSFVSNNPFEFLFSL